jgi:NADH dehydrogenase FAD-containing subunit
MGGNSTKQAVKHNKHIVIVGGSFAGFTVAMALWNNFRVTIIDKKEYFENTTLLPRCMIDENLFTEKLYYSFNESRKRHNNAFDFIQGELTTVNRNNTI